MSEKPYCERCRIITLPDTVHYCDDCYNSKLTRADALAEYSDIIDKWFDVDGNATSSPPRSAVLKFRAALAAYREE